jgi:hypothetical protein
MPTIDILCDTEQYLVLRHNSDMLDKDVAEIKTLILMRTLC